MEQIPKWRWMRMVDEDGQIWYNQKLVRLRNDLEELLGVDLNFEFGVVDSGEIRFRADTPVAKDFASIVCHFLNGKLGEGRRTLWRLLYYKKHLREVAQGSPRLLERFQSTFQSTAHDPPNFYGTMFEVEIAASFLRKGISFEKRESPDFGVNVGKDAVGVECTTGRLEGSGLPLKKLEGRIKKKGTRGYMSLSDAVFVDATGALYASAGGGTPRMRRSMEGNMKRIMAAGVHEADVGAALAFFRVVHDGGGIETIFSRVDHLRVAETLRRFLDATYPYGERALDLGRIWYLDQN